MHVGGLHDAIAVFQAKHPSVGDLVIDRGRNDTSRQRAKRSSKTRCSTSTLGMADLRFCCGHGNGFRSTAQRQFESLRVDPIVQNC